MKGICRIHRVGRQDTTAVRDYSCIIVRAHSLKMSTSDERKS